MWEEPWNQTSKEQVKRPLANSRRHCLHLNSQPTIDAATNCHQIQPLTACRWSTAKTEEAISHTIHLSFVSVFTKAYSRLWCDIRPRAYYHLACCHGGAGCL